MNLNVLSEPKKANHYRSGLTEADYGLLQYEEMHLINNVWADLNHGTSILLHIARYMEGVIK